jgi:hypothetical protein
MFATCSLHLGVHVEEGICSLVELEGSHVHGAPQ